MNEGVCTVTGIYPPDNGGPAQFAQVFSKWQKSKGFSPRIITLTDAPSMANTSEGFLVKKITRNQNLFTRYLQTSLRIRGEFRKNIPVLVNGCFLETLFASLAIGHSYVAKVPGDIVWERAKNKGLTNLDIAQYQSSRLSLRFKLFRLLFSASLKRAQLVITPSEQLKYFCTVWGINPSKIVVVYNSVSDDDFYPITNIQKKFDVISVGRLARWKGNEEIIQVCHNLGLRLAVVGSGPEFPNLQNIVNQLQSSTTFLGDLSRKELNLAYNESRFFVLNSTYEGTSHVLLEARACGLLAIARANVGSNSDVVSHLSDGILFGAKTGMSLTDALTAAVSGQLDIERVATFAIRDTKKRFGIDANFGKIYQLVSDMTQ